MDLSWDDREKPFFDFERARVVLPAEYNKSDADQWVPLHPDLVAILTAFKAGLGKAAGPVITMTRGVNEISARFTALAKSIGLAITLHDLRRSFGSRYAAVVTALVLQRLMRHANIKTTLAYYTDIDDQLDQAILKA